MRKVIDYEVLCRGTINDLVAAVLYAIQQGWEPIGGVDHTDFNWAQAMVKYE